MSNDMDSSDVIVIAPKAKNEDGSQTFYILDPCPSSEECTNETTESEIEIVTDVTAEVKNTVAFALLSTNSDTGALEIRLTKKAETEDNSDVQSEMDLHLDHLNSSLVAVAKDIRDEVINCTVNVNNKDKDERFDNGSCTDQNASVSSNVTKSVHVSQTDSSMVKIEQEDDLEEDKLYIDDKNDSELKNDAAHGNVEDLNNIEAAVDEHVNNPIIEAYSDSNVYTGESDIKPVNPTDKSYNNIVPDETENTFRVISSVSESTDNLSEKDTTEIQRKSIDGNMPHDSFIGHESLIQNNVIEVPSEAQCLELKTDDSEYGDSTKTALTLLELAGGTSLRHDNIQRSSDLSLKENKDIPCSSDDLKILDDVSSTSCNLSESLILAGLHPVQPDIEVNQALHPVQPEIEVNQALHPVQPDIEVNQELHPVQPNIEVNQEGIKQVSNFGTDASKSEISIHKSLSEDKLCNDQVQRLIEGDTPMLGSKGSFNKRKSHRGVVTQNEIVEIYERSKQKCYYTEPSKDVIFAMKLAHRLATKIVPPEKPPILESDSEVDKLNATPSSSLPSGDSPLVLSNTESDQSENKKLISDKIELLKILEDDPDDHGSKTGEVQKLELVHTPKMRKSKLQQSPLIKRHPELEKELALKQLQTFSENKRIKKGRPSTSINVEHEAMVKDEPEDNNNLKSTKELKKQTNSPKKRVIDVGCKSRKKFKGESNTETVIADPMQITETLTINDGQVGEQEEQVKEGKCVKQYSNKRLSRNLETPPREVPLEILLNGDTNNCGNTDKLEESTSKNKIFKASNPRKRKEELTRKRQKHFANVLQRNKPPKKRGRPPGKKKPSPLENMFDEDVMFREHFKKPSGIEIKSESNIESGPLKKVMKQVKSKKMREIERLLGDEGAINMLYSVEQKRVTGSEPKRGMLPSYRRKKKDLILKTKLVKTAVLRLSTSPSQTSGRVSLRGQALKGDDKESADESFTRKLSVDSNESHNLLSYPPTTTQPQPIKIAPAEASRIIRRHSSSSNYSSRSNSPRRPSVDSAVHDINSEIGPCDNQISLDSPKYKNKVKLTQSKELCMKRKVIQDRGKEETLNESKPTNKKNKRETIVKFKSNEKGDPLKMQSPVSSKQQCKLVSFKEKETSSDISVSLEKAVKDFTNDCQDNKTADNTAGKATASLNRRVNTRKSAVKISVYKKATPTPSHGSGIKSSLIYNELNLKRSNHLVEINIDPASTKLKNSLNTHVLKELTSVLNGLSKDENCHIVLISSSGNVFCQGVDFVSLIQPTPEKRMAAAHEMAVAIKDFMMALAVFPKPIVAGVQGAAVGLGTTMLPLFDMVLSSSEATFHTPYAKLGQVPEGGATLTLPTLYGPSLTSELLLASRKLSAAEAHHFGLVTRILWGNNFHEELIAVLSVMASQSSQAIAKDPYIPERVYVRASEMLLVWPDKQLYDDEILQAMDATKVLLRHNLLPGLETTLMSETHLLMQHWTGSECQANFNLYLQDNDPATSLQKLNN